MGRSDRGGSWGALPAIVAERPRPLARIGRARAGSHYRLHFLPEPHTPKRTAPAVLLLTGPGVRSCPYQRSRWRRTNSAATVK